MSRVKKISLWFLGIYLTSYLILSTFGNYYVYAWGPAELPSGDRVIYYHWFPAGTGTSPGLRNLLFNFYRPLNFIDSKIWHNQTRSDQKGPRHLDEFPK